MRVLTEHILVAVNVTTTDRLVADDSPSRGIVHVSGFSAQVKKGEEVLFGKDYEEIDLGIRKKTRYYLMHESNIKIIYQDGDDLVKSNILPFLNKGVA